MIEILPWQQKQMRQIFEMSKQDRLPHALLFSGPDGIGLKEFSLFFAASRLCLTKGSNDPCGHCQSCELFKGKSNPDIKLIEPDIKTGNFHVDTTRDLVNYTSLKAFLNNDMKIIIINEADVMNRFSANSLLKMLEEPSSQSMFILLSHRPSELLVTIRSRCQKINFYPTYSNESIDWVEKNFDNSKFSADLLLNLAGGAPLRVEALLEEEYLENRAQYLKDLELLNKKKANPVNIAACWNKLGAKSSIHCLMQLTNDLVRLKLSSQVKNITNTDLIDDLQGISNRLDLLKLIRSYDFILLKYKELTGPMNYNSLAILEEIALFWKNYKDSMA